MLSSSLVYMDSSVEMWGEIFDHNESVSVTKHKKKKYFLRVCILDRFHARNVLHVLNVNCKQWEKFKRKIRTKNSGVSITFYQARDSVNRVLFNPDHRQSARWTKNLTVSLDGRMCITSLHSQSITWWKEGKTLIPQTYFVVDILSVKTRIETKTRLNSGAWTLNAQDDWWSWLYGKKRAGSSSPRQRRLS